ncbi:MULTISPECIES: helix-turn-helix domain-containing protein [Listeria]|uniref:Helix-turn-helix transcriptional regulator n=1 Tax=Listeria immobilis TaxID=2713502 RepID=A0ABR6SUT7_9LIST|nr:MULTISPECIES: helix-turn-helix transcriptional regulator [Listeria]EAD3672170.1 XRE family transcriptional regulator [Listeria monocytogenes]EJZ0334617.1 helix-turn-helix transcriptional regulator [Listeria monocytogenes]EJZ0534181.1 helix-turn-helix transcriptional regulator [Listeria monocytogenes]EKH9261037.1 helix-turn-helix transcriptional regulator [Listeria monocytogenes]MBC1509440.1 helix-turn-helix transcriptional regulator [Listeria immobilis]
MNLTKLKKVRLDKGMSCADVASKIGITKNYYWMIERGERNLSYSLAVEIAKVFEMQPDEIFLSK